MDNDIKYKKRTIESDSLTTIYSFNHNANKESFKYKDGDLVNRSLKKFKLFNGCANTNTDAGTDTYTGDFTLIDKNENKLNNIHHNNNNSINPNKLFNHNNNYNYNYNNNNNNIQFKRKRKIPLNKYYKQHKLESSLFVYNNCSSAIDESSPSCLYYNLNNCSYTSYSDLESDDEKEFIKSTPNHLPNNYQLYR